jgi:hypothetical protein
MLTAAARRMTAIRFEELKLWPEAFGAWNDAIAALPADGGAIIALLRIEMQARARGAYQRARAPLSLEDSVAEIEGALATAGQKPEDKLPVPGAAERGSAGRTTEDAGAR